MRVSSTITVSVLIATYNRPDYLERCLDHLDRQTLTPQQIIVVDSSKDDRSERVARQRDGLIYIRNPLGRGHTATSRRLGIEAATAEIVAFIDDDAFAEPEWLAQLLRCYADQRVSAVGGRATNGQPGEETLGLESIGQFLQDGTLTGHFAADPGHDIFVDHLLGANMSLRLSVVRGLGGIADYYPGTCLREESEIVLRMRAAGYLAVYTPTAVVEHVGGTYARGRRFDARYAYYAERNHIVLLARVLGPRDPRLRRYRRVATRRVASDLRYAFTSFGRGRIFGAASVTTGFGRGMTSAAGAAMGAIVGSGLVLFGRVPRAQATVSTAAEVEATIDNPTHGPADD